jgi:hypothetical protein
MPVYDYHCNGCRKPFELVLTLREHDVRIAAVRMWNRKLQRSTR